MSVMKVYDFVITRPLIILLIIVGGLILAISYLNYKGYCFERHRYLSDQELIDRVVKKVIWSNNQGAPEIWDNHVYAEVENENIPPMPYYYTDLKDFYEKNPDCCHFIKKMPEGYLPDFIDRVMGRKNKMVHIVYTISYVGRDGKVRLGKAEYYYVLSNCGIVWSSITD